MIVAALPSGSGKKRSRAVRKSRRETISSAGSFSNPSGISDSLELIRFSMSSRSTTCFLASLSSNSTAVFVSAVNRPFRKSPFLVSIVY